MQREVLPKDPDSFEPFEIAEVEAELALAEGKYQDADEKIKSVIACFVDQDLAGREVKARLLWAKALDALGRHDEAERNLSQALRRAVIRGLIGHADQVRAALAESGGSENMTRDGFARRQPRRARSQPPFRPPQTFGQRRAGQRVSRL